MTYQKRPLGDNRSGRRPTRQNPESTVVLDDPSEQSAIAQITTEHASYNVAPAMFDEIARRESVDLDSTAPGRDL
jgi:hypothetical protein